MPCARRDRQRWNLQRTPAPEEHPRGQASPGRARAPAERGRADRPCRASSHGLRSLSQSPESNGEASVRSWSPRMREIVDQEHSARPRGDGSCSREAQARSLSSTCSGPRSSAYARVASEKRRGAPGFRPVRACWHRPRMRLHSRLWRRHVKHVDQPVADGASGWDPVMAWLHLAGLGGVVCGDRAE